MREVTNLHVNDVVARIPYFAGLDPETVRDIARAVRTRSIDAKEQILVEGEPCVGLYIVLGGHVRLVKTSADGREHVMRVLGSGATYNDVAVFDGGDNSDSAIADGPGVIGLLPRADVNALVARHPQIAVAALKLLSTRQRALGVAVENLALRDVTTRVARLILGCVKQHDHVIEHAPDACSRITHQDIASMVGSVREVAQRALKELERDGAIVLERTRITVRDPAKLEEWANR